MNIASQALALADPSLLNDRRKLMRLARMKVDEDGYRYKHGKSRSKHIHSDTDTDSSSDTIAKRHRTTETERMLRISFINETQSDIMKQIGYKEKRREQLVTVHNYGECEKISDEIFSLKKKWCELQIELSKLNHKQQQSENKKQKQHHNDISDTDSNAPVSPPSVSSISSRSATASPIPDQSLPTSEPHVQVSAEETACDHYPLESQNDAGAEECSTT